MSGAVAEWLMALAWRASSLRYWDNGSNPFRSVGMQGVAVEGVKSTYGIIPDGRGYLDQCCLAFLFGESSNGRTSGFGLDSRGSSPRSPILGGMAESG